MDKRNVWQSARFVVGALLVCGLGACAENAAPPRVEAAAHKDVCEEAADYTRRAAQYDGAVRAALQKIASTKSRECAAKTKANLGPTALSSSTPQ
jgi:hypothetical protein